jgi:surfactin synthase thioesterase subunit
MENLPELVEIVIREMKAYLTRREEELTDAAPLQLALYGHSFGSLLVYEVG